MNEIEVATLPKGIEGFLSELRPATKTIYDREAGKTVIDKSTKTLEIINAGLELVKQSLREIYSFGETVSKGTPKFCLDLKRIYDNLGCVEDSSAQYISCYGSGLVYKPSLAINYANGDSGFTKLISKLGISSSAAYRYKDLAHFVDEKTCDFYKEFQGYSISLLTEIWSFASSVYLISVNDLKKFAKVIPAGTTIEEMRAYRKAYKELSAWGEGLFKGYTYNQRQDLKEKSLSDFLKIYNELVQKREAKKLEATMSGVQNVAKEDKSVKTLPADDEITVKKEHYQKLSALAEKSMKIGLCAGCKHSGTNLNKCRCCRRYENLKDLFEN